VVLHVCPKEGCFLGVYETLELDLVDMSGTILTPFAALQSKVHVKYGARLR